MLNTNALQDERGNAIVTAILVLGIMLSLGLAAPGACRCPNLPVAQRTRAESTFNLAEGALSQQIFILGRRGTGTSTIPYPPACGTGLASDGFCPDPARLALNYDRATQKDFDPAQTTWRTWVRDNASAGTATADTFWSDALLGDPVGVGGRPRSTRTATSSCGCAPRRAYAGATARSSD